MSRIAWALGLAALVFAQDAVAATVTMTRTAGVVRGGTQGAGTYDAYDFFYSSAAGAEFTNYRLIATTAAGTMHDTARLQDDRQTQPPSGIADGNTMGAVDTYASTVWAAVGKDDLGYTSSLIVNPGSYNPNPGGGASAGFNFLDWSISDTLGEDDNDLSDANTNGPVAQQAPYHLARILTSVDATGTAEFRAFDTSAPGVPFVFQFLLGPPLPQNTPPSVLPEAPDLDPPFETGAAVPGPGETNMVTTTFEATDAETPLGPFTFSNAVLSSFVPYDPLWPIPNPAFNGTVDAAGNFSWDTTGFRRGTYTIDVTVTDGGPGDALSSAPGGGFVVTIDAVPEPSTLALFGLAMVSSLGLIRRRNG